MIKKAIDLLIVEDEEAHAALLKRAFESRGGNVNLHTVCSLKEARDHLSNSSPKLLITDLFLPDGKGTEFLNGNRDKLTFPVVIMTCQGDERSAVEAIRAGALDYVVKSTETLSDMPHIAERALREWNYIVERKRAVQERERLMHDMEERIKDLSCMYSVANAIRKCKNLDEIFEAVVSLIPPNWHYPQVTEAMIRFDDKEYVSGTFIPTQWKQVSDIIIDGKHRGSVEVYYLDAKPVLDEGPFLIEERHLIDAIANTLSEAIQRKLAEKELWAHQVELELQNRELHIAQKALEESKMRYVDLYDFAPVGYFIFDSNGSILEVNLAGSNLLKVGRKQLVSRKFSDFVVSQWHDKFLSHQQKVGTNKSNHMCELKLVRPDGVEFYAQLKSIPTRNGRENCDQIRTAVTDITHRKEAEDQLKTSLQEKEVLLREVHHRVKNNLQIISSLLRIQADHLEGKQPLELLEECQSRIRSIAMIHERLFQSDKVSKIDYAEYVEALGAGLFRTFGVNSDVINFNMDIDKVFLNINQAIPCGLILNELLSNALKHAFPDGRKGQVDISLRAKANGNIVMSVSDNGVGFPDGLDFRNTDSVGLGLVTALSRQLGARINLEKNGGTSFAIQFRKSDSNT